jgi:hypothetical protein
LDLFGVECRWFLLFGTKGLVVAQSIIFLSKMRKLFLILTLFQSILSLKYFIGNQGDDCFKTCSSNNMNCVENVDTGNSTKIFQTLGINCQPDLRPWWAEDQPCYVSDPKDPNYGHCLGYINTPGGVQCGASFPSTRRLCACENPDYYSTTAAFGIGLSGAAVTTKEVTIFQWILPSGVKNGVMTHFWSTAPHLVLARTMVRYYIDGETTASISFLPPLACGVGFADQYSPWGTKWFGKGAADGAWFNNFRIPFQKTIRITVQHLDSNNGGFYMIVRGLPNLEINIGGIVVPPTARMNLIKFDQLVDPVAWVPVVDIPSGKGLFFMHTLAVKSGNLNFLEGCYHLFSPYSQPFPGTLLSTGTEDYFDSAWYFNGGQFWLPVSGFTHIANVGSAVEWSAYRFHEMDPLPFDNGIKILWRNGDVVDPVGQKCRIPDKNGIIAGNPTQSNVTIYAWVYTW